MEIYVKMPLISTFLYFVGFSFTILSYRHFSHTAASSTVIDDVTN